MLQNAYFLAKIGAGTAENEQHFAEILPKIGNYPTVMSSAVGDLLSLVELEVQGTCSSVPRVSMHNAAQTSESRQCLLGARGLGSAKLSKFAKF